jgi:asparagine synthase (glutamine-hydrolysing)
MARDVPAAPVDAQHRALPLAPTITDWSSDTAMLQELLRPAPSLPPETVLRFGDEVLLLSSASMPDTALVAVEGALEYVVDATEEPEWYAFLRAVDGRRSLAEVFAATGATYRSCKDLLVEALDRRVLVPGAVTAPVTAGPHGGGQ